MKKIMMTLIALSFVLCNSINIWADHHAVKIASKEGIGNYLTDAKGMTLYWFKKDSMDRSACSEGCLEKWPIYYRETIAVTGGLDAGDFSTITRADGQKQTTFRGYPLYYFFKDGKPGDAAGQGVKEVWYVIDPANFPAK